jgi:hypothetical protein
VKSGRSDAKIDGWEIRRHEVMGYCAVKTENGVQVKVFLGLDPNGLADQLRDRLANQPRQLTLDFDTDIDPGARSR